MDKRGHADFFRVSKNSKRRSTWPKKKKQKEFDWVKAFFQKGGHPHLMQTYQNSIQIALQKELEAWADEAHRFTENAVTGGICEDYCAVILDGVYGRVRDSETPGKGVLLASLGVTDDGDVSLLGVTPALTESPDTWAEHLQSLINRGLKPESVRIVTTDNHVAFSKTIPKFFASAAHQPCIFHTSMDVTAKVPMVNRNKAKKMLSLLWSAKKPCSFWGVLGKINSSPEFNERALRCLHRYTDRAIAYFEAPENLVKKVRTTNQIELLFRSFRSRTRKLRGWQTYESLKGMLILTADSKGILKEYT